MSNGTAPGVGPITLGDWHEYLREAAEARKAAKPDSAEWREADEAVQDALWHVGNLTSQGIERDQREARLGAVSSGMLASANTMSLGLGRLLSEGTDEALKLAESQHGRAVFIGNVAGAVLPGLAGGFLTAPVKAASVLARAFPTAVKGAAKVFPGVRAAAAGISAAEKGVAGPLAAAAPFATKAALARLGPAAGMAATEAGITGLAEPAQNFGERLARGTGRAATAAATTAALGGAGRFLGRRSALGTAKVLKAGEELETEAAKRGMFAGREVAERARGAEITSRAEQRLQKLMTELPPAAEENIRRSFIQAGVAPGPVLERAVQDELARRGISTF